MPTRLRYPEVAPGGYAALSAFGHYLNTETSLDPVLKALVDLRASQLNRCHFCIALHTAELRKHHEPASRITALLSWETSDAFTPRERAALRWTELLTLNPHVSDDDYTAVSQFFQGKDLADLTYAIAAINAWNRLGIAFTPEWHPHAPAASPTQDAISDDGGKVAQD